VALEPTRYEGALRSPDVGHHVSIKLMSDVWASDLPFEEKTLAVALADFADDEGEHIFPSVARLSWKVGRSERSTQRTLAKLRARGVLVAKNGLAGGWNVTVHYRLRADQLPPREPFRTPDSLTGMSASKGDVAGEKGDHSGAKGCRVSHPIRQRTTNRSTTSEGGSISFHGNGGGNGGGNGVDPFAEFD
jgi:hypothetical protein